ncbi:TPM domain-containing protein [Sandaracinobacter neustonicus]|uniref:TPM domain-containing protein n=1 Tax=Sandaracinobacter neustonicus TaxID=1715348 RepID=A0A501XNF1_9SPHN|nr:TPM domain-containing protein [Sandaracinobacter neustonicus]TPE62191.1 TPM domain-containing protein [Sandaracinobacter neustonicus]
MLRNLALSLLLLAAACGQQPPRSIQGWVTDEANLLSTQQKAAITARLVDLERTRGHQFVVVTVNSLGGQSIETFTRDLGNSQGIGRKDANDGVILLVAPNERQVRIEVGSGLEQTLTDEKAAGIIQTQITPRFVKGDMPGGIAAGVGAIITTLDPARPKVRG